MTYGRGKRAIAAFFYREGVVAMEKTMYDGLCAIRADFLDDDVTSILKVSEGWCQIEDEGYICHF